MATGRWFQLPHIDPILESCEQGNQSTFGISCLPRTMHAVSAVSSVTICPAPVGPMFSTAILFLDEGENDKNYTSFVNRACLQIPDEAKIG